MISLRAFESSMTSPREMQTVENAIHLVRGQRVMLDSRLPNYLRLSGSCWRGRRRRSAKSVFTPARRARATAPRPGSRRNGKHARHTAPDQIDSQHFTDYKGAADGGCVEDA